MQYKFTESSYENAIIELFVKELGYDYLPGPEITRDYRKVVLEDVLRMQLKRINPHAPKEAIKEAIIRIIL